MPYDRQAAVAYARRWAFGFNPRFYNFDDIGGDCTNFVSQCLLAGGSEMNFEPVFGWYYVSVNMRAPAWTGVNELYNFLVSNNAIGPAAVEIELSDIALADIIQLDFSGDGNFDHTPIVVDSGQGTPDTVLVAAHSNPAFNRPLSTYNYRGIRCLHITD